ncbi:DUF7007 domain-containing protein [Neorhizobium sp. LjRoot104]|uniref:DUF7007 domain-containing protein n=1 Tax=Neorhizobium sp. LjRoot104 TaxID=3342254 RepID=UPI003ECC8792
MSTLSSLPPVTNSNPDDSGVEYGRSGDGILVARIGDLVFAMTPGRVGHFVASAWRLLKPLDKTVRANFYSHHGAVEGETAFRARMAEQAEHSRELQALDRKTRHIPTSTPWGASQGATIFGDGVVFHHTASHGGFHLATDRNAKVHPMLRSSDGFYEEDCFWAAVTITFPALFTTYERRVAEKTLKDWQPDAWEAITGDVLAPGASHERDRRSFEAAHAGDWIVISALCSDHHAGMTEVIATRGGERDPRAEERRFLVASMEYEVGRFGFAIDEARHAAYDGPSSFVSWAGRSTA